MRKIIPLLLLLIILTNCGLHPPISEDLVFSDEYHSSPTYELGVGASRALYTTEFTKRAQAKYDSAGIHDDLDPSENFCIMPISLLIKYNDNIALGLTPGILGIGAGLDFTAKLADTNYLTVVGNMYGSFEAILQKRIFWNGNTGFSLGCFVRQEAVFQDYNLGSDSEFIAAHVAGFRSSFKLSNDLVSYRGFAGIGIDLDFDTPVVLLGVNYNLNFERYNRGW